MGTVTFQSVILAGVYDVRNLKRKIRQEEEHKLNSPWNIAAKFKVDMSFAKSDIAGMLKAYESDHHTGMDTEEIAELIYRDTSGYPYLVSAFCKLMDEEVGGEDGHGGSAAAWSKAWLPGGGAHPPDGKNTLFDSLIGKLEVHGVEAEKVAVGTRKSMGGNWGTDAPFQPLSSPCNLMF